MTIEKSFGWKMLPILGTIGGVIGVLFVSMGDALHANMVWSISNPILLCHNYRSGDKFQMIMFLIYSPFAWFGVYYLS